MSPRLSASPDSSDVAIPLSQSLRSASSHGLTNPQTTSTQPISRKKPPRIVAKLDLQLLNKESSPSATQGGEKKGRGDPILLARDPSDNTVASMESEQSSGMFSGLLSGLTKVFGGGSEAKAPLSVDESLKGRETSEIAFKLPKLRTQWPEGKALRHGEIAGREKQLLFKDKHDPQAVEFVMFLEEDGEGTQRIPALCMRNFGTGKHALDLWVLPHNALRREVFDMYEIFGAIRTHHLSLTWGDLFALRRWWRLFVFFWQLYAAVQDQLLTPLVNSTLGKNVQRERLRERQVQLSETRDWISFKFEEISSYLEEFEDLPSARALVLLCRATDGLGTRLAGYFSDLENLYPDLIEQYLEESVALKTKFQLLDLIRTSPFPEESTVFLVRWMETGPERSEWLATHLWWGERSTLSRMYKRFMHNHGEAVERFKRK